jgi:tetratricopeptide (TPR) repeat protein
LGQAKTFAEKAFELKDRVSEREKMYISEKYYGYVTGQIDKSIEVLESWAQTYPNDFIPHNNLAVNYSFLGRYEEALKQALEAARLDPNNVAGAENVIDTFIRLKRIDEGRQKLEQLRAKNPDAPPVHFHSFELALLQGDEATMERETQWGMGKVFEPDCLMAKASRIAQKGQIKSAEEWWQRSIDSYQRMQRSENASQALTQLALTQAFYGDCQHAKESADKGMKLSRGKIEIISAAMTYARCGATSQSQALIDEGTKTYPKDTGVGLIGMPVARALLELFRGNGAAAVEQMEPVRPYDRGGIAGLWNNYIRGEAYLQQRMGKEAAAEFQMILDHREIEITSGLHPLAHLGLARAAALNGDLALSRKQYQDFFALWKDADPDLPILVQARKEYEGLK